jgi:hypothetical protein
MAHGTSRDITDHDIERAIEKILWNLAKCEDKARQAGPEDHEGRPVRGEIAK